MSARKNRRLMENPETDTRILPELVGHLKSHIGMLVTSLCTLSTDLSRAGVEWDAVDPIRLSQNFRQAGCRLHLSNAKKDLGLIHRDLGRALPKVAEDRQAHLGTGFRLALLSLEQEVSRFERILTDPVLRENYRPVEGFAAAVGAAGKSLCWHAEAMGENPAKVRTVPKGFERGWSAFSISGSAVL